MEKFIDFINSYIKPDEVEVDAIIKTCRIKSYKKDAFLLRKGQIARNFVYLKKGSIWVAFEDNLGFEMTSYFTQKPTELYLQALEEVEVYVIDREEVERMLKTLPIWQEFYRKLWEETIIYMIERIMSLLEDSAEVRYEKLLKEYEYLHRVAVKDIASFIGIAPGSLSRLRSKIR